MFGTRHLIGVTNLANICHIIKFLVQMYIEQLLISWLVYTTFSLYRVVYYIHLLCFCQKTANVQNLPYIVASTEINKTACISRLIEWECCPLFVRRFVRFLCAEIKSPPSDWLFVRFCICERNNKIINNSNKLHVWDYNSFASIIRKNVIN